MFKKPLTVRKQILAAASVVAVLALTAGSAFVSSSEADNERQIVPASIISAGLNTTQVVSSSGTRFARGLNNYGQLGSANYSNSRDWSPITSDKKIVRISSPYAHSVALTDVGEILTWGDNRLNALGVQSDAALSTPQIVPIALSFKKISAGANFAVALDNAGNLYSWGTNDYGQLGNGTTETVASPTIVSYGVTFQDVKAGRNYVVALDSEGKIWSWGLNNHGQLGNGTTVDGLTPQKISDKTWSFVNTNTTSETTVAIDTEGELYAWGSNSSGQVGVGTNWRQQQLEENAKAEREIQAVKDADAERRRQLIQACEVVRSDALRAAEDVRNKAIADEAAKQAQIDAAKPTPTPTPGSTGTPAPSTPTPTPSSTFTPPPLPTYDKTCAQEVDATFTPTDTSNIKPVIVPEPALLPDAVQPVLVAGGEWSYAAVGTENGFAVNSDNDLLYGWGSDANGQTGLGLTDEASHTQVPVQVSSSKRFGNVDVGDGFAAAVTTGGELFTWGSNEANALGGPTETKNVPTSVTKDAVSVALGFKTGYVIKNDGNLYSWGEGRKGLLGNGQEGAKSAIEPINQSAVQVSVSAESVVALNDANQLLAWGSNDSKIFGKTSEQDTLTPKLITTSPAVDVAAGNKFSVSVDSDGKVWAWGSNIASQSGVNGTGDSTISPVLVPLPKKIKLVSAGSSAAFAVDYDNNVWMWGGGNANPVELKLGADAVKISAGFNHAVVLTSDGALWNWGVTSPDAVLNAPTDAAFVEVASGETFIDVSAGGDTTVAVSSDGALYGWGVNTNQQLNQETGDPVKTVALIDDSHKYEKVSLSSTHALAVDDQNAVYAWGNEPYGTFGRIATVQKQPFIIPITETESTK